METEGHLALKGHCALDVSIAHKVKMTQGRREAQFADIC